MRDSGDLFGYVAAVAVGVVMLKEILDQGIGSFSPRHGAEEGRRFREEGRRFREEGRRFRTEEGRRFGAEEEVRRLQDESVRAALRKDVGFFERVLSDGYINITARGGTLNKRRTLDEYRSGEYAIERLDVNDVRVRVYHDVAVVTGVSNIQGRNVIRSFSGKGRFSRVFIRDKGQWRIAAHQTTPIPEPSPQPETPWQPGTPQPETPRQPGTPQPETPRQPGTPQPETPRQPGTPQSEISQQPEILLQPDDAATTG